MGCKAIPSDLFVCLNMGKYRRIFLALLLPIQYFGLQWLRPYGAVIEQYYSLGVYPLISTLLRYSFGWIPFSIGDIFYPLLIFLALRWCLKNYRRLRSDSSGFFLELTGNLAIIYFVFNLIWGLNYLRPPLYKTLQLSPDYTTEELIGLTKRLAKKSNALHRQLGYPDSVKIDLPYTQERIFELSRVGYERLGEIHPEFDYRGTSIKSSLWSLGLTYMGYSGYYNPITGEAQVNDRIKNYKFPVVSAHEQAHQMGFAAENEANFIATLATIHHPDPYIRYSGSIFALRYCLNEVARRDRASYEAFLPQINYGILESYREMREFWESYKNPFESISKVFWDQFLKANHQSQGIRSYSYMVALLVQYDRKTPF